jgi:hypothetical protein
MTVAVETAPETTAQDRVDLDKLDVLLRGARADHDAFEALKRKSAAVVFRCGSKLIEAREIAKRHRIGWYSKLDEYGIAESTARQAINLWQQATDAGYTEEDFEDKAITEAKIEFNVVRSPAQQQADRRLKQEKKADEEAKRKADEEVRRKAQEEGRNRQTAPADPTDRPNEANEGPGQLAEWGEIKISDLLRERQRLLREEALKVWNAGRKLPYDEEYLLVLLDLGVLSVEDGWVCYLPDRDDDREELVATLGDKLAPILERWTTPDDVVVALKELVFSQATEAKSEATMVQEPVKKPGRRSKGERRS